MYIIILSSLVTYLASAGFSSYSGGNCGYVLDEGDNKLYPLDVCIQSKNNGIEYATEYTCYYDDDDDNNIVTITADTWRGTDCNGDIDHERTIISGSNPSGLYNCGPVFNSTIDNDACYFGYRVYEECTDLDNVDYVTEFIITATCLGEPWYNYVFCDVDNPQNVQYVEFNDYTCCDISFKYKTDDEPNWYDYDITVGCHDDDGTYIDENEFMCAMPDDAQNTNVYTDNTDPGCLENNSHRIVFNNLIRIFIAIIFIFSVIIV